MAVQPGSDRRLSLWETEGNDLKGQGRYRLGQGSVVLTGYAEDCLMYSQAMGQTDKVNPCFEPKMLY